MALRTFPTYGTLWSQGVVFKKLLCIICGFSFDNEFSALKVWKQERSPLHQTLYKYKKVL